VAVVLRIFNATVGQVLSGSNDEGIGKQLFKNKLSVL
jgi:hypothetical protein